MSRQLNICLFVLQVCLCCSQQVTTDDCTSDDTCLNGGICGQNSATCFCEPPWTGIRCESEIDESCDPELVLCLNGGTCDLEQIPPSCICEPPWTGKLCDIKVLSVTVSVNPEVRSSQPQQVELVCEYAGINPPYQLGYLAWYFVDEEPIYSFHKDQGIAIHPGYEDRIELDHLTNDSMKLWLLDANLCDTGSYTCVVHDDSPEFPNIGSDEDAFIQDVLQLHWGEIGAESCVTCGEGDNVIIVDKDDVDKLYNLSCIVFYPTQFLPLLTWDAEYSGKEIHYSLPNLDGCNTGRIADINALEVDVTVADGMEFACEVTAGDTILLISENVTIIVGEVDQCWWSPCENGGTCEDLGDTYKCSCPDGIKGPNCETKTCVLEPCQNGGTCEDGEQMYKCQCPDGISGMDCQIHVGECLADIALVIDTSGSITEEGSENWSNVLDFVRNTIYSLDVGTNRTRVAAVTFSTEAYLQWDLDDYTRKEDLLDVVDTIYYEGLDTNTTGGLKVALEGVFACDLSGGDRPGVNDVIILITDGEPTIDTELLNDTVNEIKSRGIRIVGVGVTSQVNEAIMRYLVTQPWEAFYMAVEGVKQLSEILERVISGACKELPPIGDDECSSGPCQNGGTCVDGDHMYKCSCPDGIAGNNCQIKISKQADIPVKVWPVQGPQSGGTKINIQHPLLYQAYDCLYLGSNISLTCNCEWVDNKTVQCETPSLENQTYLGEPLQIGIQSNETTVDLKDWTFTYKPDPVIKAVFPRATIVEGGTTVTIQGSNLDVIAKPLIFITLKVENYLPWDYDGVICTVVSSATMYCKMPPMPQLLNYTTLTRIHVEKRSVRDKLHGAEKRSVGDKFYGADSAVSVRYRRQAAPILGEDLTEDPKVDLDIKQIILDNVQAYIDFKNNYPDLANLDSYRPPEIYPFDGGQWTHRPHWPHHDDHIKIKGKGLMLGKKPELLIAVLIGAGSCVVGDVTQTSLFCSPPSNAPKPLPGQQDLQLLVYIGNVKPWSIGKVEFQSQFGSTTVQIILGAGSGLLLLLIIMAILLRVVCNNRNQKKTEPEREFIPEGENYLLPESQDPHHWRKIPTDTTTPTDTTGTL